MKTQHNQKELNIQIIQKKKKEREREWKGFDAAGLEDGRSGAQMKEYGQPVWATSGNLKI